MECGTIVGTPGWDVFMIGVLSNAGYMRFMIEVYVSGASDTIEKKKKNGE